MEYWLENKESILKSQKEHLEMCYRDYPGMYKGTPFEDEWARWKAHQETSTTSYEPPAQIQAPNGLFFETDEVKVQGIAILDHTPLIKQTGVFKDWDTLPKEARKKIGQDMYEKFEKLGGF